MNRTSIFFTAVVAILLGAAQSAHAQINVYSVDQTVTGATGPYTIDIDGDGTDDYTFEIFPLAGGMNAARVISLGGSQVMDSSTFGYPDALDLGDNVSEPYSSGNAVLGTDVGGGGLFTGLGMKYLGLNVSIGGESHLGWISLEVSSTNDTIILYEVGYATVAGTEVTAGGTGGTWVGERDQLGITLYPNPCVDRLGLFGAAPQQNIPFAVTDMSGRMVLSGTTGNSIDVSMLTRGSYVLTLGEPQNAVRISFVKD